MNEALDAITLDALSGSWRIFQRQRGHRWSIDDLLTAYVACRAAPGATTHLDLGCGIGSVLLLCAYKLGNCQAVGIEAQEASADLCRASIEHNAVAGHLEVRHADFRHEGALAPGERFALITGTPPYLPLGTATLPRDPQRAAARVELRGGLEDYCQVAARHLGPHGTLVLCADGRTPERTARAARDSGLHIHAQLDLIPLPGKGPLFHVVTLRTAPAPSVVHEPLLARTLGRQRTLAMQAVRSFFDMPASADDAVS